MAKGTREQIREQNRRRRERYRKIHPDKIREYKAKRRWEAGVVPTLITSPAEKLLRKLERWVLCPRADREDLSGLSLQEKRKRAKKMHFKRHPGLRRFYKKGREEDIRKATPPWADKKKMREIYESAKVCGFDVDHIVPLRSEFVCGLHCEANLRAIPKIENAIKSNRFWPDMP